MFGCEPNGRGVWSGLHGLHLQCGGLWFLSLRCLICEPARAKLEVQAHGIGNEGEQAWAPEPGLLWGSMVTVWLLDWPFPSCYGLRPGQGKLCGCQREKIKPGRWKGKEVRRCRDRNIQCESELRHALAGILPWHPPLEDQSPTLAWMEDKGQAPVTSSTGWTGRRRRPGWRGKWKDHGCRKGKKGAGNGSREADRQGGAKRDRWWGLSEVHGRKGSPGLGQWAVRDDGTSQRSTKGIHCSCWKKTKGRWGKAQEAWTSGQNRTWLTRSCLQVWRHRLCPLGLGENVSNGIREKLAKQTKKDEAKAPVLQARCFFSSQWVKPKSLKCPHDLAPHDPFDLNHQGSPLCLLHSSHIGLLVYQAQPYLRAFAHAVLSMGNSLLQISTCFFSLTSLLFSTEPPIFYHIIWLTLVCLLFIALSSPLQCKHPKGRNLVYFVHCCSIITELSLDHSGLTKDVCWMNPWKNERVGLECTGNRREHIRGQTGGGRGEKEEKQGGGGGVGGGEV